MKQLVEKFIILEQDVSKEKGDFSLFALFLREDVQDKWDLLVAASWIEKDPQKALRYLVSQLQQRLESQEMLSLSRIVMINKGDPALEAMFRAIRVEHGRAEVQNSNFFGLQIEQAYIITSKRED